MSRSRSKAPLSREFAFKAKDSQNWIIEPSTWLSETMWESAYPGPCNMTHVKHGQGWSATGVSVSGNSFRWTNQPGYIPPIPLPTKLDWGKLPTSSEFGIIQFFAELDDTLLLFTKKFWKQLSYGSFTWGVLPFVSDIKALLQTIKNLSVNLSSFSYEDSFTETHTFKHIDQYGHVWEGTIAATYRYTGSADISFHDGAQHLLDRLGFHPDLATAWDLVPLSFVLDWFLPVGDFLEGLRGGGWTKVAYFKGWQTCKWVVKGKFTGNPADFPTSKPTGSYTVEGFSRYAVSTPLFVEPTFDLPELTSPTLRQAFNMAYIAGAFKKVIK